MKQPFESPSVQREKWHTTRAPPWWKAQRTIWAPLWHATWAGCSCRFSPVHSLLLQLFFPSHLLPWLHRPFSFVSHKSLTSFSNHRARSMTPLKVFIFLLVSTGKKVQVTKTAASNKEVKSYLLPSLVKGLSHWEAQWCDYRFPKIKKKQKKSELTWVWQMDYRHPKRIFLLFCMWPKKNFPEPANTHLIGKYM